MADKKISALTSASTPLAGSEVLPVVQSGATVKVSVDNLTAGRIPASSGQLIKNGDVLFEWNGTTANTKIATLGAYQFNYPNTNYFASFEVLNGPVNWYGGGQLVVKVNTSSDVTANPATEVFRWDNAGNTKWSVGNIVQGTAAKGVNFTANTPAAGMTSQLLNWYEEGDWTPTVTSTSGTITSYTASGTWTRIGRLVTVFARLTITNVGTGAGGILVDSLPYAATSRTVGTGRDNGASGKQVSVSSGGSGRLFVVNYDNTFPVTTGSEVDLSAQFYA